jgi:hypothetical protein
MGLAANAIRTLAALKTALEIEGNNSDPLIEDCINEASQMVRDAWGRELVSPGSVTEFHTLSLTREKPHELYLNEFPLVSITTVHEDPYGANTLLVVDTDYIVSKPAGKLTRVSAGVPIAWPSGWRMVKGVYVPGFKGAAGTPDAALPVPNGVVRVFDELVAWMIKQRQKKEVGLNLVIDGLGHRHFDGPAYITDHMRRALFAAGATPAWMRACTGERDA